MIGIIIIEHTAYLSQIGKNISYHDSCLICHGSNTVQ